VALTPLNEMLGAELLTLAFWPRLRWPFAGLIAASGDASSEPGLHSRCWQGRFWANSRIGAQVGSLSEG
jgi:hypothetical protein